MSTATATKPPTVSITGNGGDVVIVRPTGRVTIVNGYAPEDADDLAKRARLVLEGSRAMEIVRAEGDVEIEGDVNDVIIVEGEAVIVNGIDDDDEEEDEDEDE